MIKLGSWNILEFASYIRNHGYAAQAKYPWFNCNDIGRKIKALFTLVAEIKVK